MVDTIAVLYRDEDVESYKKGDFGIQPYRADLTIPVKHSVGEKEAQPAVFSSHSGAMIDFSISSASAPADAHPSRVHLVGNCFRSCVPSRQNDLAHPALHWSVETTNNSSPPANIDPQRGCTVQVVA